MQFTQVSNVKSYERLDEPNPSISHGFIITCRTPLAVSSFTQEGCLPLRARAAGKWDPCTFWVSFRTHNRSFSGIMPGSNIWRSLLTPRKAASRRGSRSHDFAVAQSDEVRSPGGINVTVVGDVVYGCKSPTSREEDDDTVVSAAATAPLSRPISLRSSADSDDGQRLAEGFRLLLQGGDENLDRACSWFGEAAAACPADASSLHAHAILLVRQQRCHEAEEIFKRILALEGECPSGRTLFRYASLKQLYLAEMVDTRKERVAILEVAPPHEQAGVSSPRLWLTCRRARAQDAAKMYMKVTLMRDAFTVAALFNLAALRYAFVPGTRWCLQGRRERRGIAQLVADARFLGWFSYSA
jgi:hypothetical protein